VKRIHKIIAVRVALVATLLLSGCVSIAPIDPTGTWSGTLTWTDGPANGLTYPLTLQLLDEETETRGTVTLMGPGSQLFDLTIWDAAVHAHSILVEASGTMSLVNPPIRVAVRLDGDFDEMNMSGTGEQTADGRTYAFTWQLVRITPIPQD